MTSTALFHHRFATLILAVVCLVLLIFFQPPAQARNVFDIVSIDLSVSPNPIPCGGSATGTATIQLPKDKEYTGAIDTTIDLWDYDTLFRDGDDLLDRKSGLFWINDDKIVVEFTLHCQIKESGCELYGPSGNSGESGTYVFVRIEDSDTKSPRVYVQCKQMEMDAILRLDGPDGPDTPEEPTRLDDDNTILPGSVKIVTLSAEESIHDLVSGAWTIRFDPASLVPTQVDYIHPEFLDPAYPDALHHEVLSDHIAFEFNVPSPGRLLGGELVRVHFEALESPAAEWAPAYVQCGEDGSFTNSLGEAVHVCMGGPLSLFIPPKDQETPVLHPERIHFGLREITGRQGAVTDNRSDLERYLTVALYDENHERVAAGFAEPDGSFQLGTFFMLSPEKPSSLTAYDGVNNTDTHWFIPVPDLADSLSVLQMLNRMPQDTPLVEDVTKDDQTGLAEGSYILQRISEKRNSPELIFSIAGTVSPGAGGTVNPEIQPVSPGSEGSFTLTPVAGYQVSTQVGGTCPAGTWDGDTYTTGPVTADCTVAFSFDMIPFPDLIATLAPDVDQNNTGSGVSEDTDIQIEFTNNINDSLEIFSADEAKPFFRMIESESGTAVTGVVSVENRLLTFSPAEPLKQDMTYWLTVSENIFSITSPLPDPETYHWSLTTQEVSLNPLEDTCRVWHPVEGAIPRIYHDVGYEIDGSRNLTLAQVHDMILTAEAKAVLYNNLDPSASPPPLSTEKFTQFHFWPNIINLSAVFNNTPYPDLFNLILTDLLQHTRDPAALAAQITSDVSNGDRVFIARDFIDKIIYNFVSYFEVHYVMIINLDQKSVTEIPGHQYSPTGLPGLHDPHTELLQAAFDSLDDSPGEVWDMCLRGNRTRKYQAVNVDRLLTESGAMAYFITRVDLSCLCPSCAPFDSGFWDFIPDVPWEPWNPPVIKIPEIIDPPPGGNGGGISGPPPAAGNPLDTPEDQPIQPWPFPVTPLDDDTINPDSDTDGDEETGDQCEGLTPGCDSDDFTTAAGMKSAIDNQLQEARNARESDVTQFSGDRETTWGFRYEWNPDAHFNAPCIQELFDTYNSRIAALKEEVEDLLAEYRTLYDNRKALRDSAYNVFQALMYRENLWSNMLEVSGDWHDVEPEPCMPPWIPAGGNPFEDPTGSGVVIVGARLQAKFQRVVAYAMMNGKTFDQAVEEAINSRECYPDNDPDDPDTQPRATVYKDTVFIMIWKQYAECLKRLYAKIARNYMNRVFGDEENPLSQEDVNSKVAVLLLGASAMSPSEQAEYDSLKSQINAINERLREISEEISARNNQIDALRREFRQKALDCLKASLENIRRLRAASWVLQAFLIWCENPESEEAFPQYIDLERFCSVLDELFNHPDTVLSPKLKAYLAMLKSCNC